jgi:hypothetical protein
MAPAPGTADRIDAIHRQGLERRADDDVTTGSIGTARGRSIDRSAKDGNAELNDRSVSNYGATSGGPAE